MVAYDQIGGSIRSVVDLMEWFDRPFVELAYRVMLKRPPDPEGMRYYLKRLRAGHSRTAVLDQLWKSPESDPLWDQVRDLEATLTRFRKSRRFLTGAWLRWSDPEIGTRASFRRARSRDNMLGHIRHDIRDASNALAAGQDSLRELATTLLNQQNVLLASGLHAQGLAQAPAKVAGAPHNPRLRSVYDVRDVDLSSSGRRTMNTLRI
ncbi:DUF4214 domain-containing protein [Sphingobium sp. AN558]|uniref:DUF4214 domain-containing protein n=1 Tax=Sphingobium sp. AN558 TaxID=3133442 RepID=UPI0030C3FE5E